jgi:hypothetical protein
MVNIIPFGKLCLFAALFLLPGLTSAQLRLQSVSGKKTAEIPIGATIGLKQPPPGQQQSDCECYWSYKGIFKGMEAGKVKLLVQEETLIYLEGNGMYKKVQTRYSYTKREMYTDVDAGTALSVTKYSDPGDAWKGFGAIIIGLSLLQSFAISPFLSYKARDTSDKIVWGGIGVGLTMILLPSKKTWHLQQPTGKNKRLWRLK